MFDNSGCALTTLPLSISSYPKVNIPVYVSKVSKPRSLCPQLLSAMRTKNGTFTLENITYKINHF